jgi:hypothetical protein
MAAMSDVPVLYTATADAQPAGSLADLIGQPVDANIPIVGHLAQQSGLVRGQNQIVVWGHDANRMAAVVSEEIPFKIDIVQPKRPLVRNGSLQLVVATRAAGFTRRFRHHALQPAVLARRAISRSLRTRPKP